MTKSLTLALIVAALGAIGAARAAGVVEVSFAKPEQFADFGRGAVEIERNSRTLREHLQTLARRLPDGQTLRVEFLDVDLAGELKPTRRADDVRVMRGGADWPSMKLRYALVAGDRTLASGEETIAEMDYLNRLRGPLTGQPLGHDRQLLERWFIDRIVGGKLASR